MTSDDVRRAVLAAPPRPPLDPDLFSSNALFGEPGIYPQGTPMVPAVGDPPDETAAIAALEAVGITDAVTRMTDAALRRRAPEPGPRAGLVALTVSVAAPVLEEFLAGRLRVQALGLGVTASPGRIIGPRVAGPGDERVVNERYRAEHPALLAGSLAHDLLWSGEGAGQYEEVTLHALCALVHAQLLARAPFLAATGTESGAPVEFARDRAPQLAAPRQRGGGRARPRRSRHHPGWCAGHADPGLLEHPVRLRCAGRGRRARARAATCSRE